MGNRSFVYKREKKDRIKKIMDIFEEGRTEMAGKKIKQGSLFGMTYITWKEGQTYGSLLEKALNLQ